MPKLEVSEIAEIIKRNRVEPPVLRKIVEDMNVLVDAKANQEDEKPPAIKKQFVILVSDPESLLPKKDFAGWVLQIAEGESAATTQERIFRAAYEFNTTKRGRLLPVKTVGEALENVPAKHFKDADLWVKNKTPVWVITTDNSIPKEKIIA